MMTTVGITTQPSLPPVHPYSPMSWGLNFMAVCPLDPHVEQSPAPVVCIYI
jgi:hypothetical protein